MIITTFQDSDFTQKIVARNLVPCMIAELLAGSTGFTKLK